MKAWWTAGELAGLPGLPASDRNIRIWGQQGKLTARERALGKGWEYLYDSLPHATRVHLCILAGEPEPADTDSPRVVPATAGLSVDPAVGGPSSSSVAVLEQIRDETPEQANQGLVTAPSNGHQMAVKYRARPTQADRQRTKAEGAEKFAALPPDSDKRLRAKAREWYLLAAGELRRNQPGLQQRAAIEAVCGQINNGERALPEHVAHWIPARHGVRALAPDTLYRWATDYAAQGLWGLTDGYGNRLGASVIERDQACYRAVLGMMLRDPQAGGRDIHAWLRTVDGLTVPTLRTVQRFRERWIEQNHQLWTLLTHPGKWKNHFQVAFGSQHESVIRLNQLWELDSTPGDWLLTDGRHTVVGCIDLWSRRLKLRVSKTSSGFAVGQCWRAAVLAWGVPEMVRTDNGKDYVGDYYASVLRELEVTQELCIPFASEQKGTIERAMKTICYTLPKLLPGYIGHNVAEREAIRARETFAKRLMTKGEIVAVEMSGAELQSALDRWVDLVYSQDPHQGEGMGGLSPVAKAASWRGTIRTVDARALDSLLAPIAGERTIGKKGIRWDHRTYISPILAEFIGEPCLCRYDEADLGRLFVYRNSAFLCIAEDPAMTGISRAEVAAVARAKQKAAMAEHTKELRAIKRDTSENAAEAVLRHRAEASGKLVAFPQPETPHSTPGLTAGAAAADARRGPVARAQTPAQIEAQARVAADLAGETVVRLPTTAAGRYRRWIQIQRDTLQGLPVSREDLEWWDGYAESSEYRAQKRLAADFPENYGLAGES